MVNRRQIDDINLFLSLNMNTLLIGMEINTRTNSTHPDTNPNAVTYIACPKVFHCTVSDAETDK